MNEERARHEVHNPNARRLFPPRLVNTIGVLTLLEEEEDALVLEHNGETDGAGHYNCLVRCVAAWGLGAVGTLPACIYNAIELGRWSG